MFSSSLRCAAAASTATASSSFNASSIHTAAPISAAAFKIATSINCMFTLRNATQQSNSRRAQSTYTQQHQQQQQQHPTYTNHQQQQHYSSARKCSNIQRLFSYKQQQDSSSSVPLNLSGILTGIVVAAAGISWLDDTLLAHFAPHKLQHRDNNSNSNSDSIQLLPAGVVPSLLESIPPVVVGMFAINAAVFLLWRSPRLQPFMTQHFTCSYDAVFRERRYHTLLTSAVSHAGLTHFLFNMMALTSISMHLLTPQSARGAAVATAPISSTEYIALYITAAVVSQLASFPLNALFLRSASIPSSRYIPSLGASGVAMCVFAVSALIAPHSAYYLMLVPYPIEAQYLFPAVMALDVAGLVYNRYRSSPIGHGVHLMGSAVGVSAFVLLIGPRMKRRAEERERERHRRNAAW